MKKEIINTLERAVSTDIVRLQSFATADLEEVFRQLVDSLAHSDSGLGDGGTGDSIVSPLRAHVIGGLMVKPDLGTADTFILPGTLAAVNPYGGDTDDDSPLKIVNDPGIPSAGILVLTANSSGSTRIDVVECSVAPVTLEADSRDVFNPLSGLFSAVTIPKVTRDALTFRIRTGTPGGGFPGTVTGWLPLMVASVPTATTIWDTCTCWDVRPLVSARVKHPHNVAIGTPRLRDVAAYISQPGSPYQLTGFAEVEAPDGYVLGGLLQGRDGTYLDLLAQAEPGWTPITDSPWFLYFAAPFGLPRWAQYTASTAGQRLPSSPVGIPVFTQVKLTTVTGTPLTAVAIPVSTGLLGSTLNARCALAGNIGDSGTVRAAVFAGKEVRHIRQQIQTIAPDSVVAVGNTEALVSYTLRAGQHFPAHATKVRLRSYICIRSVASGSTQLRRQVSLNDGDGNLAWAYIEDFMAIMGNAPPFVDGFEFDAFLPVGTPNATDLALTVDYTWGLNTTGTTFTSPPNPIQLVVLGWTLQ